MTELVINAPELQTHGQRLGAVTLTVLGCSLWCYILFPLVTLSCWLVDNEICSRWVNLSGGYLQLQQMLSIYVQTICGLALLWAVWAIYNRQRQRSGRAASHACHVSHDEVCAEFGVHPAELVRCRASRYAVVHFDEQGQITALEAGVVV